MYKHRALQLYYKSKIFQSKGLFEKYFFKALQIVSSLTGSVTPLY